MMLWGILSGTILSICYGLLEDFLTYNNLDYLGEITNTILFSLIYCGSLSGLVLGFLYGSLLWLAMNELSVPNSKDDFRYKELVIYLGSFIFVFVVSYMPIKLLYLDSLDPSLNLPPLMAALAATLAAHHYLIRLQKWGAKTRDPRKSKLKNDDSLVGRLAANPLDEPFTNDAMPNEASQGDYHEA